MEMMFRVNAQRFEEFMALVAKAQEIHEGIGGRVRVWKAGFAGKDSGIVTYHLEVPDLMALAKLNDRLKESEAWNSLLKDFYYDGFPAFTAGSAPELNPEARAKGPIATAISSSLLDEITPIRKLPK
jgi:hypothetical protein